MQFTDHKVHKPPEILGKDAAGNVLARFPDGVRRLTADQLEKYVEFILFDGPPPAAPA